MAYSSRRYIKHIDKYGTVHRLEIQQKDYSGSESSISGDKGRGAFQFTHEEVADEKEFLKVYANPIQKGKLEIYPIIEDSTDFTLLQDMFQSDEEEFRLVWKRDGSVYWMGYVLVDLLEFEEASYPYSSRIVAKDFSRLKGMDYTLDDTRQTWITTIADLLGNLNLGLDIETATSWTEENLDGSLTGDYDYLGHIYHETKALREFAKTGDETDQPITVWEALERVLSDNCLILKQIDGKFKIDQLSEYDTPSSVLVTTYDSTGSQTAQTIEDKTLSYDRNVRRVKSNGSKSKGFVAIKRAKAKYDHRTKVSNIKFAETVTLDSDNTSEPQSQLFISDGDQRLTISADVEADINNGESNGRFQWRLQVASYYWDHDNRNWTTTTTTNEKDMTFVGPGAQSSGSELWIGSLNIETNNTPSDADGTLTLTLLRGLSDSNFANETRWKDTVFSIINPISAENSESINYQLTQSQGFSENYGHADTWFGDGPLGYSPGALRYSSSANDTTHDSWQRRGTTTGYRNYHENLLKEIIDIQRTWVRRIEAAMYGTYDPTGMLQYRSGNYYYIGGSFDGASGDWNVRLMDVDIQTGSDTFEDIPKFTDESGSGTGSTGSGSGGGGLDQSTADARYFKQNSLFGEMSSSDQNTAIGNLGITATKSELNRLDGSLATVRGNLGLTDGSADLDLNSLDISGSDGEWLLQADTDGSNFAGFYYTSGGNSWLRLHDTDGNENVRLTTTNTDDSYINEGSFAIGKTTADDLFDVAGAMRAETLRTNTGKFLAPTSYAFRNAGDSGFRDVQMAGLTATTADFSGTVTVKANIDLDSISGSTKNIVWRDSGSFVYGLRWEPSDSAFQLRSDDIGGGTTGNIFEVDDGQQGVRFLGGIEGENFSDWFSANPNSWKVKQDGTGDFRTLFIDELVAKAFTVDVAQALAGSDFLTKSITTLAEDFTVPATGNTVTITVEDLEGLADTQVFEVGDWVRFRVVDRSGGGLTIVNVYGTVSGYTNNADDTQDWTYAVEYAGSTDAAVGETIYKGSVALDYGTSGDTFIERTVLNRSGDTDYSKVPYDRVVRWTNTGSGMPRPNDPDYSAEVLTQRGNLNGLGPFSSAAFGVYAKDNFYVKLNGGRGMNLGKNVGPSDEDGIHIDSDDYWYSDGRGSVGNGILNWNADANEVGFAGFTADADKLTSGDVRIDGNSTNQFNGVGFAVDRPTVAGEIKQVRLGQLQDLDSFGSLSSDWGLEAFIRNDADDGWEHVFRLGGDEFRIAGSYFDATDLWGYTSGYSGDTSDKSNASVRLDFAEGRIYYDAMGQVLYNRAVEAAFSDDANVTFSSDYWTSTVQSPGDGTQKEGSPSTKVKTSTRHKYGINTVRIQGYARVRDPSSGGGTQEALLKLEYGSQDTGYIQVAASAADSSSWFFFDETLDVSSISEGTDVEIGVLLRARVNGDTSSTTRYADIREDLKIVSGT